MTIRKGDKVEVFLKGTTRHLGGEVIGTTEKAIGLYQIHNRKKDKAVTEVPWHSVLYIRYESKH